MNPAEDPIDDEGGDAACWAHLFEGAQGADLAAVAAATAVRGPAWRLTDTDLNANLLVFDAGQGIESHVNTTVDVLIIGVAGSGTITIDGATHPLAAGRVVLAPRGSTRSITAETDRLAYLTVHRARPPMMPSISGR
ncbi:MAG: cupin domain-containing protein [Thermomicrobiales bacterium]|nr:MAG: cupin domain-containing protein [Thermomicrobiales bacterium]